MTLPWTRNPAAGATVVVIFACLALAAALGLSTGLIPPVDYVAYAAIFSLILAISAVLVVGIVLARREAPQLGLRNPGFLLFAYLGLIYVGRPVYILVTGEAGTHQIGYLDFRSIQEEFAQSLLLIFLAITAFTTLYLLAPRAIFRSALCAQRQIHPAAPWRLLLLLALASVAGLTILREIQSYPGGWQAALVVRKETFEGRNYLILMIGLYKAAFLVWLALIVARGTRPSKPVILLTFALWMVAIGFDLVGGGRLELILRNILPAAAALSTTAAVRRRPYLFGSLTLLALITLFIGYRTVVRDQVVSDTDESIPAQIANNVIDLPTYLVGGDEASALDYFLVTRMQIPANLDHRGGESIAAIVQAPVPARFFPEKPERAGEVLTREIRPAFYERGGNIAFSGASDLYFSFGSVAVIVGFGLIGLLAGTLVRGAVQAARDSVQPAWPLCFGFVAAAAVLSLIRADLFELSLTIIRIGMMLVAYLLLTTVPQREARSAPALVPSGWLTRGPQRA